MLDALQLILPLLFVFLGGANMAGGLWAYKMGWREDGHQALFTAGLSLVVAALYLPFRG